MENTGYEDTPYVKGSKKTKTKKGTGKGVCAVTSKPHEFLWVRTSDRPYFGKMYGWGREATYYCVVKYCVDCGRYDRRSMRAFSGTGAAECRKKVCTFLGEDWVNVLWVNLTTEDRIQ